MKRLLGIAAGLALVATLTSAAHAADLPPLKAPAPRLTYPTGSGFYYGMYGEGGGGAVNGSVPGVASSTLASTQGGGGLLVGYVWTRTGTPYWAALEGKVGYNAFNGSTPGFSFSGPLQVQGRVLVGGSFDQLRSLLPNLGLPNAPPFLVVPGQPSPTDPLPYLAGTLTAADVSANFGASQNKVWEFTPGFDVGMLGHMPNGTVVDVYAGMRFAQKSILINGPAGSAVGNIDTQFVAGMAMKF